MIPAPISGQDLFHVMYGSTFKLIKSNPGRSGCADRKDHKGIWRRQERGKEAEDIYETLARRYLDIGCSVMTPNPNRLELLGRLMEEFKVDGVVEVILQACHTYSVESMGIRKFVNGKGKPYISVETDYSMADLGQLNTRLAAFIEML